MPLLAGNTTEQFGLSVSGTGTVSWVLSCNSRLSAGGDVLVEAIRGLTAQGLVYAPSTLAIPSSFTQATHGAATRELQFFSAVNQGTASNVVTLGKIVTVTLIGSSTFTSTATNFFQFSPPSLLQPQESLIYVQDSGFQVYDAQGLKKTECCSGGTSTGQPVSQGAVAALSYQTTTQTILNTATTAVQMDTLSFASPASMYNAAQDTHLAAPQAGLYSVMANIIWPVAGANTLGALWFLVNGAGTPLGKVEGHIAGISGVPTSMLATFLVNLNAGDYVEAYCYQNNGSSLTLSNDAGPAVYLSLALVR